MKKKKPHSSAELHRRRVVITKRELVLLPGHLWRYTKVLHARPLELRYNSGARSVAVEKYVEADVLAAAKVLWESEFDSSMLFAGSIWDTPNFWKPTTLFMNQQAWEDILLTMGK